MKTIDELIKSVSEIVDGHVTHNATSSFQISFYHDEKQPRFRKPPIFEIFRTNTVIRYESPFTKILQLFGSKDDSYIHHILDQNEILEFQMMYFS